MIGLQCEKCGHALALADAVCSACGNAVPAELRLKLILPRAEAFAADERFADAARALEPALALSLDAAQLKGLWRKKGVWLRKAAVEQPLLLDAAEAALAEALRLDDADELSHQVWIDLLVQRDYAEKARAWYQQRLQLNPDDAVAKKQMLVLKLAADFKSQPRPKSQLDVTVEPTNFLWRSVVPTPLKTWVIGLGGLPSLWIALRGYLSGPAAAVEGVALDPEVADALVVDPGQMMALLADPGANLFNAIFAGAYVYWAYTRKKERQLRG